MNARRRDADAGYCQPHWQACSVATYLAASSFERAPAISRVAGRDLYRDRATVSCLQTTQEVGARTVRGHGENFAPLLKQRNLTRESQIALLRQRCHQSCRQSSRTRCSRKRRESSPRRVSHRAFARSPPGANRDARRVTPLGLLQSGYGALDARYAQRNSAVRPSCLLVFYERAPQAKCLSDFIKQRKRNRFVVAPQRPAGTRPPRVLRVHPAMGHAGNQRFTSKAFFQISIACAASTARICVAKEFWKRGASGLGNTKQIVQFSAVFQRGGQLRLRGFRNLRGKICACKNLRANLVFP